MGMFGRWNRIGFGTKNPLEKNENVQEQQILRKKVTPVIFVEEEDEVVEPKNELSLAKIPSKS